MSKARERAPPTNGVIHGLVNGGTDPSPLSTKDGNLRHFKGCKVAETQLYKLPLLVQLVNSLESFSEWSGAICCMQIEDIDCVGLQLFERKLQLPTDDVWLVGTELKRVPFRGQS